MKCESVMEQGGGPGSVVEQSHRAQCVLSRLRYSSGRYPPPPRGSYPPISSIPRTSPERLALASPDGGPPPATVLYLAYGSNMCAETFLGRRGIRPLSQLNVSAPAFDLSFDLPGIPYVEPCFANTTPRHLPRPPPPGAPELPPLPDPGDGGPPATWDKGLYGVVYEVTREDYAEIIRTEGGGASYRDVLTPCVELPPALRVPEKPPLPDLPRPFLAHTLYAPRLPDPPDDDDDSSSHNNNHNNSHSGGGGGGRTMHLPRWLRRLLLPARRPSPDYAQPSLRYLNLLRTGAREHALPDAYVAHLDGLRPYFATSWRQRAGALLLSLWAALVVGVLLRLASALFGDKRDGGRVPRWLALATTAAFAATWVAYDAVLRPVFGDGERTQEEEEEEGGAALGGRLRRRGRWTPSMAWGGHDEKSALMADW
ncbi:hypothetical protein GGR56DRAFT_191254 [Xylariaceae sp. FL0804]|nr:hypothetical protein GGR56DRAFT_191254 [Xylariaceae sp. FL0804]